MVLCALSLLLTCAHGNPCSCGQLMAWPTAALLMCAQVCGTHFCPLCFLLATQEFWGNHIGNLKPVCQKVLSPTTTRSSCEAAASSEPQSCIRMKWKTANGPSCTSPAENPKMKQGEVNKADYLSGSSKSRSFQPHENRISTPT